MTAGSLLARASALLARLRPGAARAASWAWSNRTLVLGVAVVLLVLLNVRACGRAEQAESALADASARAAGEARAAAADVPVARVVPQAVVDEEGERAKRENPALRAELDRVRAALGRVRLELVARVRTAPAPVAGAPRPPQPATEAPRPVSLLVGDALVLDADLAVGETADGAHVLVGALEAWRALEGHGQELLLRQPYSAPATIAVRSPTTLGSPGAPAAGRPWRAGVVGGVSGSGWLAGGAYTRRLDVRGWRPELVLTIAGGPRQGLALAGALF